MLTLAVLVFCACVTLGLACSCMPESGPDRFCKYPVVVRGVATAEWEQRKEPMDHNDPYAKFHTDSDWVYTVHVNQAIIMPSDCQQNKTIEIRTPTQESMCGVRFPLDVPFVFFGWVRTDGGVATGLCDPNTDWDSLDDFNRELIADHLADICTERAKNVLPPPDSKPPGIPPPPANSNSSDILPPSVMPPEP